MSTIVGLAVASDELRAVAIRDGAVYWAGRADREPGRELSAQIAELLLLVPAARWRRPAVVAAIGPSEAQVKRLTGLPELRSMESLNAVVREGAGRFFLRNGIPLDTSSVRPAGANAAWAAAFERPTVREIEAGCRRARVSLRAVVPAVAVILSGVQDGSAEWRDGLVASRIVVRAGVLESVRRLPVPDGRALADPPPAPPIAGLNGEAWRFADAYGAARTPRSELLALRPAGQGEGEVSRRRFIVAATAVGTSALFAILAPVIMSATVAARASAQLARLAPAVRTAAAMEHDLRRMTRALSEVDGFAATRRSPTRLLANLTSALPQGASLVDLHVDGAHGSLVLLAPRAARAIATLDSVAAIVEPEVVGPVTREMVGARELERATVRFSLVTERAP